MSIASGDIVGGLVLSLLVGLIALSLIKGLEILVGIASSAGPRYETRLLRRVRYYLPALRVLVWLAGALIVLAILLDVASPMTGVISVIPIALGLGLALRDYFSDVLAGMRLAIDRPFFRGDRIAVGPVEGTVLALGLTRTRIRTDAGRQLYLPNHRLVSEGYQTFKRIERDVPVDVLLPVPEGLSFAEAKETAYRAAVVSRFASPHLKPEVFLEMEDGAVTLRVRAYASTPVILDAYRSDMVEIWLERVGESSRG